jgi:hypothetical protein
MIKRTLVLRECLICKTREWIRKDGVGILCRSCRAKENHKNKKPIDISLQKFGKLIALNIDHQKNKIFFWKCLCECGNYCVISGCRLRKGKTKSCGCIVKTQNNLSTSSTYKSWSSMINRCHNEKNNRFENYGKKGIKVCDEWRNSFFKFLNDMGERPKGKSINRINNFGNYELKNCKWSTNTEQTNNKSNNYLISFYGKTQTLTQWAKEYNIGWSTLRKRVITLQWSIEKSLLTPIGKYASN